MKAIILAAGFATRLYPLTENQAKPLLPIGNKSILEHILHKVEALPVIDHIIIAKNSYVSLKNITHIKECYNTQHTQEARRGEGEASVVL